MKAIMTRIIIIGILVFLAYKFGWIENIKNYFEKTAEMSKQEQVIYEPDGSVTKIKYRNVLNMIFEK